MANFRTHLGVAAAAGAVLAHGGWQAGLWNAVESLPLLALVTFGGILPDIDADRSRAIRLIFNLLAVPAVVAGALMLQSRLATGSLLMVCGAIYLGVRYLAGALFARFTVHRGLWHSLLAAGLCGLVTTALSHRLFGQTDHLAWAHGMSLALGFMIHLLLDELYSVDLTGGRLKRSFGTAFKPFDWREPGNSLVMLMAAASLAPWLPPWWPLRELLCQGVSLWR
ncbi:MULTISPECIES: metal-dependent hydrolase [Halomonas]|uniref:LexA-binding, inner membrane-associated putative hydrolase n=1 Tax=Halomonas ventosae TaxID=229007 RepID=A0A4R6GP84_9GAMM|nr:metal-dependent hydrolase [Halomonas ventosae]TDN97081.1 LexA-binding, inner membrane-associated putative hydrolase [Halomonas ventosae]